ncbi:MAG TPA: hypothetical protein VIK72_13505 [Clostridiaceae bacterium]
MAALNGTSEAQNQTQATSPKSILDNLVTSGVITKDQASTISAAFEAARKVTSNQTNAPEANPNNNFTTTLNNLVSKGTISPDLESTILSALQNSTQV